MDLRARSFVPHMIVNRLIDSLSDELSGNINTELIYDALYTAYQFKLISSSDIVLIMGDILESIYADQINSWHWDSIVSEAIDNPTEDYDSTYGSYYLGSVFSLSPSGKYWTLWANSNVNGYESLCDSVFYEVLDRIAEEHNGWIESGESDPCDLFFGITIDDTNSDL